MAGAVGVALLAGVLAGVQIRAARAQEQRHLDAAQAALTAQEAQEEADARAAAATAWAAGAVRRATWATASTRAGDGLATAQLVLDGSAGAVTDDAVRVALGSAIQTVRTILDARSDPAALAEAVAALQTASDAVTAAQAAWQAEQDAAAAAAAAQSPRYGGPPSTGAGADCGGPQSFEPPKTDGSPWFYTSTPSEAGDGSNGHIPASAMTPLDWCQDSQGNKQWLRPAAAASLTRLNEAFKAQFGENIAIDMSYRSYETQVEMRAYYGSAAAVPGTSNHGLGTAIDTCEWAAYAFGSERYDWLVAHAPDYGWAAPGWARQDGENPEYWHFEYTG